MKLLRLLLVLVLVKLHTIGDGNQKLLLKLMLNKLRQGL
jgi:hypothetical protein